MNAKFKYFLFVSLLITANAVCADSDYYLERTRERWKQQDEEKEKRRLENETIHEKQKQAEKN